MRTLATAAAMANVMTVPAAAKTLLKNPQRLLPLYNFEDFSSPNGRRGRTLGFVMDQPSRRRELRSKDERVPAA